MNSGKRIPISGPSITQKEIDYVTAAVTNAWYENANIYHERFQKAFASYIGKRYAIALPSCTSAIHLSLEALQVGPGDEVIVPDITWIASAAPISYVGATPVFADINPKTWCLSVESFKRSISEKTKAVIVVDLYGSMPEWDEIRDIAIKNNIYIIEDAAEALGSEYKGKKAGFFGDTGVFSFHGSKTMTTGEGGMLVTDNKEIYERCLVLRDHGRANGDTLFYNQEIAYKYKMSSMQAALGLAQLERIDELVNKKRQIFGWYYNELKDIPGIQLNFEGPKMKNSYWMVTLIIDKVYKISKEILIEKLKEKNIDTRPFFYPLSNLPAYEHFESTLQAKSLNKNSYAISPYGINLPCGMNITKSHVSYICEIIRKMLKKEL